MKTERLFWGYSRITNNNIPKIHSAPIKLTFNSLRDGSVQKYEYLKYMYIFMHVNTRCTDQLTSAIILIDLLMDINI